MQRSLCGRLDEIEDRSTPSDSLDERDHKAYAMLVVEMHAELRTELSEMLRHSMNDLKSQVQ